MTMLGCSLDSLGKNEKKKNDFNLEKKVKYFSRVSRFENVTVTFNDYER